MQRPYMVLVITMWFIKSEKRCRIGKMKFLADMGISQRTVERLRNKGYDIVHLREQGLQRLADENILAKAITEERI
uniref:DUF5615 family PIN-like protein n=1 Tax=Okeania sp. SIO2F4 TaxID=2607790 RepID=UPI0025DDCAF7|nr:DUF5615 family PIN-like protein [Okeania sp. SIO2F4]